MQKYLVMSKKSSTFAPAFGKTNNPNAVSLAQLVEQLTLNQWVEGSSPSGDTKGACGTFFCVPTRSKYAHSSYFCKL